MKIKILITDKLIERFGSIYKKNFNVNYLWKIKDQYKYSEYEALIVTGGFKTSRSFLEQFRKLKIISVFGVGYDGVDIKYCKENNITVSNTPHVLTNDVSDLAIGLLLSLSRNIHIGHDYIKRNKWSKSPPLLTDSLANKKIGIVGMGKIGRCIAKKAKAFNLEIFYTGPNKKKINLKYYKNLQKMASDVNFLIIACKGGEDTYQIINKKIINSLKKSAYLINISRGSVIDENALINALEKNKIKGAALDVFNNEPVINPRLKKLKNVLLSPHNASGTVETRMEMAKLSGENILNFFKLKKPIFKVI